MAETVTYLIPSAIVGDGSKANPRRIALFGRIDFLFKMISDGLLCLQPDGTVADKMPGIQHETTIVADLGVVAVTQNTLTKAFWDLTIDYVQPIMRYSPVYGSDFPELKARALVARNQIANYLVNTAQVTVPAGPNHAARVRTALANLDVTGATDVLRDYYLGRLDGGSDDLPVALVDKGVGLRPAAFAAALDRINTAPDTHPASWMHHAYDMALLDTIYRGL